MCIRDSFRLFAHPAWSFVMSFLLFATFGISLGVPLWTSQCMLVLGLAVVTILLLYPTFLSVIYPGRVVLSVSLRIKMHIDSGGSTSWGRALESAAGLAFVGCMSALARAVGETHISWPMLAVLVLPGSAASALGCFLSESSPRWHQGAYGMLAITLSVGGAALSGSGLVVIVYLSFDSEINATMALVLLGAGCSMYLGCFALHEVCGWKAQMRGSLCFLHMLLGLVLTQVALFALASTGLGWTAPPCVTIGGFVFVILGRRLVPSSGAGDVPLLARPVSSVGNDRTGYVGVGGLWQPPVPRNVQQPLSFELVRLVTQETRRDGGGVSALAYSVTSLLVISGRIMIVCGTGSWVYALLCA
eukprot:TRINITY_DN45897_c0_g1_i1.p1 TRINITY_DN45897_c0_g1~~TRINITY_DN45897_c0_g1_i1.p1  ORF type:complete len:360 (-),score=46.55 TRINITY_DN45897_c0_g1_i1:271-1350(-)